MLWILILGLCSMIGSCYLTEGTQYEGCGIWFFGFSVVIYLISLGAEVGDRCPWLRASVLIGVVMLILTLTRKLLEFLDTVFPS